MPCSSARKAHVPFRAASSLAGVIGASIALASLVHAQERTALARVEALGLDTTTVGRVTAYFAPGDRERAVQLATLAKQAAAFFERELGLSFGFRMATLNQEHWFSPFETGPYTIPWYTPSGRLIVLPAADQRLPQDQGFARAMDFIALHEYGHLAAKRYFHPGSALDEIPVLWFEELLATYFAFSFVRSLDPQWAEGMRGEWATNVAGFTPRERTLDWRFMRALPPDELGRTYGWYQNLLNLRVAEIHDRHGLAFLRALKEGLPWDDVDSWRTPWLLPLLESIAPGFEGWVERLESGADVTGDRGSSG